MCIFVLFWYVLPAPLTLYGHELAVLGVQIHITSIHALSTLNMGALYYGILALLQMCLEISPFSLPRASLICAVKYCRGQFNICRPVSKALYVEKKYLFNRIGCTTTPKVFYHLFI
jgi:hypothetical protein